MQDTSSFKFIDQGTKDEGWILVRREGKTFGITASLKNNGDIEVFMTKDDVRKLLDLLQRAVTCADQDC